MVKPGLMFKRLQLGMNILFGLVLLGLPLLLILVPETRTSQNYIGIIIFFILILIPFFVFNGYFLLIRKLGYGIPSLIIISVIQISLFIWNTLILLFGAGLSHDATSTLKLIPFTSLIFLVPAIFFNIVHLSFFKVQNMRKELKISIGLILFEIILIVLSYLFF